MIMKDTSGLLLLFSVSELPSLPSLFIVSFFVIFILAVCCFINKAFPAFSVVYFDRRPLSAVTFCCPTSGSRWTVWSREEELVWRRERRGVRVEEGEERS